MVSFPALQRPLHNLSSMRSFRPFVTSEVPISHVQRALTLVTANPTSLSFTRNMSSSPTKRLFVIYAPDSTDPGTLDRRLSVREEHLAGINRLKSSGIASTRILLQYYYSQP